MYVLAHLSDPHFTHLSLNPTQLLSKRWMGNLNFLLKRKPSYSLLPLQNLVELLQEKHADRLLITGDLTTTAHPKEFAKAASFLSYLKDHGIKTTLIPGNHDCYTPRSFRQKRFFRFLEPFILQEMRESGIFTLPLSHGWYLVGLDTAIPTPPLKAYGVFSASLEEKLKKKLSALPQDAKVVLANHFPVLEEGVSEKARLQGSEKLLNIMRLFPSIQLYLHGHRHKMEIIQKENLPLMLDSGSSTQKNNSHCHLLYLHDNGYEIETVSWNDQEKRWAF